MNQNSRTKSVLKDEDLQKISNTYFKDKRLIAIEELKDGMFNNSYMLKYENNMEVVIKIAPPENIDILSYEVNMMESEVFFIELVNRNINIPVPKVLFKDFTKEIIPYNFFIMEKLNGTPLNKINNNQPEKRSLIYKEMAKFLADIHSIKGDYFGYPINKNSTSSRNYFDSFYKMIEMVLNDGLKINANIPVSITDVKDLICSFSNSFSKITNSVFVHYDLWDGNIFVKNWDTNPSIDGLVDFERGYFADPAADFSQVYLTLDLENDHYFIDEYNNHTKEKFILDKDSKIRIKLFQYYLFLIMIVESYYRDINGSFDAQLKWASDEFLKRHKELELLIVPA